MYSFITRVICGVIIVSAISFAMIVDSLAILFISKTDKDRSEDK